MTATLCIRLRVNRRGQADHTTNAPVGTDPVTGTYSGGGGYAKSSGAATLTVTP